MSDPKYQTLQKIIDSIRKEAPETQEYQRFHSKKPEDIQFSRSQAFIHLFLLVKFGIETFIERNQFICDGELDGGLDSYYIAEKQKTVYLIQSKFKTTDTGFSNESISSSDLVHMELDRILDGETKDSNGISYNNKVHEFQLGLNQAMHKQIFKYKVIFLANLKNYNDYQIRKLTNKLDYEIYDFEKCYLELVKPVCSGTYFEVDKIVMELDISEKSAPQLSQTIKTSYGNCEVMAVFVPTKEIARVMYKYKNAVLRYNPRNYLGLSKNPVNKSIKKSIISLTNNDFALLNNGLTILADEQEFTKHTGIKNIGRLTLTNPQIINGGQTAYTLSEIYKTDYTLDPTIFDGKEVLVRVVVLTKHNPDLSESRFKFISSISESTNQQTQVKEADRHSNNPLLLDIQKNMFSKYGYFLELKKGEFYNGLTKGFINKAFLIDRVIMLRCFYAFKGRPTTARSQSEPKLYDSSVFDNVFTKSVTSNLSELTSEIFYSFMVHKFLIAQEKALSKRSLEYGYSLRYGKYAVVYSSSLTIENSFHQKLGLRSLNEIGQYIANSIPKTLDKWKGFEDYIQSLDSNKAYFDVTNHLTDFDGYYKGTTLKKDLEGYFK